MRSAVKLFRDIVKQRSLISFIAREIGAGADLQTDEDLENFVRQTAVTAHHPAGTCRMGSEKDYRSVVDAVLRVRGVEGLRVVDASVFPDLVGGNINAAVVMIAEMAADLILTLKAHDVPIKLVVGRFPLLYRHPLQADIAKQNQPHNCFTFPNLRMAL